METIMARPASLCGERTVYDGDLFRGSLVSACKETDLTQMTYDRVANSARFHTLEM